MSYNYKRIVNNVKERAKYIYPWCYWDNVFTEEEIDKMCKYFDEHGVERASTIGVPDKETNEPGNVTNEDVRRSNVKFHNRTEDTFWIFDRINWVVNELNDMFYNFDLNGYETIQYTEYDDHELGKYDFHMDTVMDVDYNDYEMRKLSLTILLNKPGVDFEGGDFEINNSSELNPLKIETFPGRVIAFPSFMIHRVAPVTKGKRKSLVVWVLGPKFR